jgi:hypothetical protein
MSSRPAPIGFSFGEHLRDLRRSVVRGLLRLLSRAEVSDEALLATVRQEVLHQLDSCGPAGAEMRQRVERCDDLDQLWYLRPQILAVLVDGQGERKARKAMDRITRLFGGAGLPVGGGRPPRRGR